MKTSVERSSSASSARSSGTFSSCETEEDLLLGAGGGGAAARHLDPHRVLEVRGRELGHLAAHGGREEHRLARPGQPLEDVGELGLEPHVEHPVGLVEHQHLDVVEARRPLLEVVHEPARAWR